MMFATKRHEGHSHGLSKDNQQVAVSFLCVVLALVLLKACFRALGWYIARQRLSIGDLELPEISPTLSSIHNLLGRTQAFATGVGSLSIPPSLDISWIQYSRFSSGKIFLLATYATVIGFMIRVIRTPTSSTHFIEDIAFRAGWVSITQIPLIYLLATKFGPLNTLAGFSYERINWAHRWIGRILFICTTVHMGYFFSLWISYGVVRTELNMMKVVRHGLGAYGVLVWIAVTSMLPLRRWAYKWFYLNHLVSTTAFLCLLWLHIPKHARYNIYLSLMIIGFDILFRMMNVVRNNFQFAGWRSGYAAISSELEDKDHASGGVSFGHLAEVETYSDTDYSLVHGQGTITHLRLRELPFSWRPGQHIRTCVPRLGLLEFHPFTPATCYFPTTSVSKKAGQQDFEAEADIDDNDDLDMDSRVLDLFVLSHRRFTRRLIATAQEGVHRTAIIDGPFGAPPSWTNYEKVCLIASSTGVSFTLSIMDHLARAAVAKRPSSRTLQLKQIDFIWVTRHFCAGFDEAVTALLKTHAAKLRETGVEISIQIFVTSPYSISQGMEESGLCPMDTAGGASATSSLHGEDHEEVDNTNPLVSADGDGFALTALSIHRDINVADESMTPMDVDTFAAAERPLMQSHRAQKNHLDDTIQRFYGQRPNVSSILDTVLPATHEISQIVGVCANIGMASEIGNAVAKMNIAFAFGRRARGVELFSEAFT
ncbi:uncharacterized protein BDZ99DRAFT_502658 [Mytilinidion resinicola]|uniref:FAD-binding FR-type domain-containing protein n=1 Tax=Mytilinidion resinicola TaxID=574789 RepID=A0A6A6Y6K2_9PEZI|nr:uncharacterized protein BDZ99DRAFT_502658 [Mytilinidion resinicola]KAF2804153.1 hypothetical protein BDZ99DRAFT_502658 [Mytilinidion resinicola]